MRRTHGGFTLLEVLATAGEPLDQAIAANLSGLVSEAHGVSVRPVCEAVEVLRVVVLSSFVVFLAFSRSVAAVPEHPDSGFQG